MTWAPLLLTDPSPCLRLLVLSELLECRDDDIEIKELEKIKGRDFLVSGLLEKQAGDGSWGQDSINGHAPGGVIQITSQVLTRLGYMGFGPDHSAVRRGVDFLFSKQQNDGSWPLICDSIDGAERGVYDMIPLQTALPLLGLAYCGYSREPGAEKAYDWLLAQRLEDGAWPTGLAQGNYGFVAGYRRMPHSRWGCRSNTTAVLTCLSLHSKRCKGLEARRALDLLLSRETRERQYLGFEVSRIIGVEPSNGFFTFFARFDLALILNLCWRVGVSLEDSRAANIVQFLKEAQGPYGLWEYLPKPQASRWMSFDILRSLNKLSGETDWLSMEPRTPFHSYSKPRKRY